VRPEELGAASARAEALEGWAGRVLAHPALLARRMKAKVGFQAHVNTNPRKAPTRDKLWITQVSPDGDLGISCG
jgi:hypothetical protein